MAEITIHLRTRGLVDSAILKLGPERALDALAAFDGQEDENGWDRCVLARAYGPVGALLEVGGFLSEWQHGYVHARDRFGMSIREVVAVVRTYDNDEPGRGYLRIALLREAAKMVPEQRETVTAFTLLRAPNQEQP